ncbi:MAG: hypothetical protein GX454_13000 [Brooklawnia sp.]|nr:hypothetical protein [Brooklawnia sp.]
MAKPREGVFRADAGTVDEEGFIAPSVGLVEHALHFTCAPDVLAKTRQILDADRLELPGAVVVWDETIGRRRGSKAVPGSWWATSGSVTMSLVFGRAAVEALDDPLAAVGEAVVAAIGSFAPSAPVTCRDGEIWLDNKQLGRISHEPYYAVDIFVVRVNANTDFSKAPRPVQESSSRLADYVDVASLPLGTAKTLPNALSIAIMSEVPARIAAAA